MTITKSPAAKSGIRVLLGIALLTGTLLLGACANNMAKQSSGGPEVPHGCSPVTTPCS